MKRIILTAALLFGLGSAASASTVSVSPGDWVDLVSGSNYEGSQSVVPGGKTRDSKKAVNFSHSYGFSSSVTELVFNGDVSTGDSGRASIRNLVFKWKDKATKEIISSIKLTNGRGKVIGGASSTIALLEDHDYKLIVKGHARKKGGDYSFAAQPARFVPPTPVPVPGALLLLAPALMGIVVLGRRKRGTAA